MKKNKTFDCVEMKNAIQAKLHEEYAGLTPQQVRDKRREKLAASANIIARKWRSVRKRSPESSALKTE